MTPKDVSSSIGTRNSVRASSGEGGRMQDGGGSLLQPIGQGCSMSHIAVRQETRMQAGIVPM